MRKDTNKNQNFSNGFYLFAIDIDDRRSFPFEMQEKLFPHINVMDKQKERDTKVSKQIDRVKPVKKSRTPLVGGTQKAMTQLEWQRCQKIESITRFSEFLAGVLSKGVWWMPRLMKAMKDAV